MEVILQTLDSDGGTSEKELISDPWKSSAVFRLAREDESACTALSKLDMKFQAGHRGDLSKHSRGLYYETGHLLVSFPGQPQAVGRVIRSVEGDGR